MILTYFTKNGANNSLILALILYGVGFIIQKQQHKEEGIQEDIRCYLFLAIYLLTGLILIHLNLRQKQPIICVLISNILIGGYLESSIALKSNNCIQQQIGILPLVQLQNRLRKTLKGSQKLSLIQYVYPLIRLSISFLFGFQFQLLFCVIILFLYNLCAIKTNSMKNYMGNPKADLHLNVQTSTPQSPLKIITPFSEDPSDIYQSNIQKSSKKKILKSSHHSQIQVDQTIISKKSVFSQQFVVINEKVREDNNQLEVMSVGDNNGNHFLENLLNKFHDGVIMVDSNERVIYINNKTYKLFNLDSIDQIMEQLKFLLLSNIGEEDKRMSQKNFFDKFVSMNNKSLKSMAPSVAQSYLGSVDNYDGQKQTTIKCKYVNGNTKRLLKISLIVGTNLNKQEQENKEKDSQIITSILINDITKKRIMKRLKGECEFKNQLLKSFSHELRTPLSCSSQLLAAAKDQIHDRSSNIFLILQQALLQNSLLSYQIADILDYAGLESQNFQYNFQEIFLEDTVFELKSIYNEACMEKNITLAIKNEVAFSIRTDQQRLNQVLINLLNNSVKFTPQYGRIDVIFQLDGPDNINCSVTDTGIGMTEKQLNLQIMAIKKRRCLKPIDESLGKKTGLGLSLSQRLLRGLVSCGDNELKIQSCNNKGTKIQFMIENMAANQSEYIELADRDVLPQQMSTKFEPRFSIPRLPRVSIGSYDLKEIKRDKSAQALTQLQFEERKKCDCKNILIVDDVPFNHIALKSLLLCFDLQCDQAYDGENALEMVKKKSGQHCPNYKLIFMDVEMPGMNGFETSQQILNQLQESKSLTNIIMCSAYDSAENTRQAFLSGIKDALPKPVHKSSLKTILQKYQIT